MKTSHTPGPWEVFDSMEDGDTYGIDGADGSAVVYYGYRNKEEGIPEKANARLIAAAPELLEALEALDNYVSNNLTTEYPTGVDINAAPFEVARAAIAKARGAQ